MLSCINSYYKKVMRAMNLMKVFTDQSDKNGLYIAKVFWRKHSRDTFKRCVSKACNELGIVAGYNETVSGFELGFETAEDYERVMKIAVPAMEHSISFPEARAKSALEWFERDRLGLTQEEIDIRTYSIIYDAINDLKDAMEGMLSPELKEEITGTAEIREMFKVSKIGTIAGCMVTNGKILRSSSIRLIRDGVVVYTGELASLKRFKDDAKEVTKGYDCGMQIKNYNDIKEGDIIEAFHEVEVKKKLK